MNFTAVCGNLGVICETLFGGIASMEDLDRVVEQNSLCKF